MNFETTFDGKTVTLDVDTGESTFKIQENRESAYSMESLDDGRYLLRIGRRVYTIDSVTVDGKEITFTINGQWETVKVRDEQDLLLDRLGFKNAQSSDDNLVKAPMPGKILEISCKEGDQIRKGSPVIILEAMKMENELKAPIAGTIASIKVEEGQSVEKSQLLIEIKAGG